MKDESRPASRLDFVRRPLFVILARRFLALCALLFWQGGFLFYTIVVIPVAGEVLSPNLHMRARITDQAVSWLHWAGVVALAFLLWDLVSSRAPPSLPSAGRRGRGAGGRGVCWAVMFVTLAALFGLHYWMDVLNPTWQPPRPSLGATFLAVHLSYIAVSIIQTVAALAYLGLTVYAWRMEDAKWASPGEDVLRAERAETSGKEGIQAEGGVRTERRA